MPEKTVQYDVEAFKVSVTDEEMRRAFDIHADEMGWTSFEVNQDEAAEMVARTKVEDVTAKVPDYDVRISVGECIGVCDKVTKQVRLAVGEGAVSGAYLDVQQVYNSTDDLADFVYALHKGRGFAFDESVAIGERLYPEDDTE